jgi:hypothetical protein
MFRVCWSTKWEVIEVGRIEQSVHLMAKFETVFVKRKLDTLFSGNGCAGGWGGRKPFVRSGNRLLHSFG